LNRGNKRLEPVSWSATVLVGQFSRLESETDAAVVEDAEVPPGGEADGDELQAAANRATEARASTPCAAARRGRRTLVGPEVPAVEWRVGIVIQLLWHRLCGTDEPVRFL
jgi:hypothetical protein